MMRKFAFRRPGAAAAVAGFLLICLTAMPRIAAAQAAYGQSPDAGAFIQNLGTQAIEVLGPSVPPAQRAAMFRQLLASDFDLGDAARFALGPYANSFTPAQREEFMALFRDTIAQSYAHRLAQYAGEPFRVTGTRPMGGETIVSSEVLRRGGSPVHIDWHVISRDGRFLVTDVDVNGVSQRLAERSQFIGIIQRNGGRPEALLAALQQQLAGQAAPMSGSSYYPPSYYPPAYR